MRKIRILAVAGVMAVAAAGFTATPAHACMGEVCEAINLVCEKATKAPCVK